MGDNPKKNKKARRIRDAKLRKWRTVNCYVSKWKLESKYAPTSIITKKRR